MKEVSNYAAVNAPMYDKKETAELLHVSVRTIELWLHDGKLTSKRAGRKVLIPQKAIENLLAESEKQQQDTFKAARKAKAEKKEGL